MIYFWLITTILFYYIIIFQLKETDNNIIKYISYISISGLIFLFALYTLDIFSDIIFNYILPSYIAVCICIYYVLAYKVNIEYSKTNITKKLLTQYIEQYKTILHSLNIPILILKVISDKNDNILDLTIVDANEHFTNFVHVEKDVILEKTVKELYSMFFTSEWNTVMSLVSNNKINFSFEEYNKTLNKNILINAYKISDNLLMCTFKESLSKVVKTKKTPEKVTLKIRRKTAKIAILSDNNKIIDQFISTVDNRYKYAYEFNNSNEFLSRIDITKFNIIIIDTDFVDSSMSGLELYNEVLLHPNCQSTKFIAISNDNIELCNKFSVCINTDTLTSDILLKTIIDSLEDK